MAAEDTAVFIQKAVVLEGLTAVVAEPEGPTETVVLEVLTVAAAGLAPAVAHTQARAELTEETAGLAPPAVVEKIFLTRFPRSTPSS